MTAGRPVVTAKQKPSSNCFVIQAESEVIPHLRSLLDDMATIEKVDGANIALVRIRDHKGDAKTVWRNLVERVRDNHWVAPILLDPLSEEHVPTGDVSVRFDHVLTEQQINEFALSHGLVLEERNKYVDQQVRFKPKQLETTYLPDLVDSLTREKGVARAWANTLSRYTRR